MLDRKKFPGTPACEPAVFLKRPDSTEVVIMVKTGEKRGIPGSLAFTLALICLKLLLIITEGVLLISSFSSVS